MLFLLRAGLLLVLRPGSCGAFPRRPGRRISWKGTLKVALLAAFGAP